MPTFLARLSRWPRETAIGPGWAWLRSVPQGPGQHGNKRHNKSPHGDAQRESERTPKAVRSSGRLELSLDIWQQQDSHKQYGHDGANRDHSKGTASSEKGIANQSNRCEWEGPYQDRTGSSQG